MCSVYILYTSLFDEFIRIPKNEKAISHVRYVPRLKRKKGDTFLPKKKHTHTQNYLIIITQNRFFLFIFISLSLFLFVTFALVFWLQPSFLFHCMLQFQGKFPFMFFFSFFSYVSLVSFSRDFLWACEH